MRNENEALALPELMLGFIPLRRVPGDRLNESGGDVYPKGKFATAELYSVCSARVSVIKVVVWGHLLSTLAICRENQHPQLLLSPHLRPCRCSALSWPAVER